MNKRFGNDDQRIASYVYDLYAPEDPELRGIRESTETQGLPTIQVGALDARLLEVLVRALAVRRAVEIGTLGGYSGISLLRGMGDEGVLYTCELEEHNARVAREHFRRAGFAERAHVLVGPALETLPALSAHGPFDLVFIDADKVGYPAYLDWAADNLRVGGVVLADNAFLFGRLADSEADVATEDQGPLSALRQFHERLARGGRFRATVIPTGEGLAFGVKRA